VPAARERIRRGGRPRSDALRGKFAAVKLGTLLLRNAAIGLSQLEAALRNQVLYGGRLGTNLVELGYLDLEQLSAYLAELNQLPIATPTLLEDADQQLLGKLGPDDAHRLRSIPLGYLGTGTEDVAIAMVDPSDHGAIDVLASRLGARVAPYVVPELRALYYLEKHFGTPRRARFVRSQDPASLAEDERRRTQPAGGRVIPPTLTLEPRRRRASQVPAVEEVPTALDYGAACERIDTATDREQIADAFVEYAHGRCDALVVLLVRDGNAVGWRGYVAPPARPARAIEDLSLPLGGASALQAAHDSNAPYIGPPPSPAKPVENQLWAALGSAPPPLEVMIVPIVVKQRAINLIYAHTLGGTPPPALITELCDLANRAQASYARLIRQTRSG
jgi:type II secretion system (T2SS) protein E